MKHLIVIAEDDADLCLLLEIHLRRKGYQTISVHSIKDTETLMSSGQASMVLLDNHLVDGIAMDHIRALKCCSPNMPIVLMTADFRQDLEQSRHYGDVDDFLLKPFSPEKLNDLLERIPTD